MARHTLVQFQTRSRTCFALHRSAGVASYQRRGHKRIESRRRHCAAFAQPRRRPAAPHPRASVRRRRDRFRRRLGARRPAGAPQLRYRDQRQLQDVLRSLSLDALPESDFAVKALIDGLPPGRTSSTGCVARTSPTPSVSGEPMVGRFRTAPADRRSISFVWSGDTAGQGWGIDESRGGMRIYETMRRLRPDFFIHSGDTIYADGPIDAEKKLPDGERLEERRTRGEAEGRRDAGRVPRATTNTICSTGTCAPSTPKCRCWAVGRPRGHQQLVARRSR